MWIKIKENQNVQMRLKGFSGLQSKNKNNQN